MRRICIRCGFRYAVQGRSRCSVCGPTSPQSPSPYDSEHQTIAKATLREAQGCAMAHLGGCGGPLQADHIIPLSMGGSRGRENYQALCRRHNISKGGANRGRGGKTSS